MGQLVAERVNAFEALIKASSQEERPQTLASWDALAEADTAAQPLELENRDPADRQSC